MNERERMLACLRGEPTDQLPWAPRMDLWSIAQQARGTMPERFKGLNTAQIADELGVGCHAVRADWTIIPQLDRDPRDFMWRAFGFETCWDFPFKLEINSLKVDFKYEAGEGTGKYWTTIHTPAGPLETYMEYENSMAKNGITAPEVKKYPLPDPTNWEAVAQVYDAFEVVPTPENYRAFKARIGDRGLALAQGPNSASPMHSILHMLTPMETFFYAYMDVPDELHKLAERITPFFDRILDVMCECDAEVVWWGANYDQSTTWPPFFATEIVPYVRNVGDRLRAAGKYMASHCDGENDKLLEYMPTARFDIAESVPTEPMVKRTLKELREGFGEPTTVWGGLPATAFMPGPMSDESFEAHLDRVFGELGSGKRLILGVSDNVPVDCTIERLDRVTERVKAFGPVNPAPAGQL
jgi:hypothetical protein